MTLDPGGPSVATQADASTDPAALRSAPGIEPGGTAPPERRTVVGADGPPESTPTPRPSPSLAVAEVRPDPPGDDCERLNDEYVVFENMGTERLDLTGWTVEDAAGRTYAFPNGFVLAPGANVTLRTGSGTDNATDLYWGSGSPVWNNDGDTVVVTNATGGRAVSTGYS